MKKFNRNILQIIGNTPIIKINKLASHISSEIYVKLESMNPGGSSKDRIGYYMCKRAKETGLLKEGAPIIEATSGNTGVGIAMYANIYGHQAIFVMADKQSQEKIDNLKAFGAKVIVCPTNVEPEDPRSYYSVAKKLSEIQGSYYIDQYSNPFNTETHYHTTGPEIFEQTQGEFDIFMATVGTGGTISGTSKYLKEKMPHLKVVGVDCHGSILAHYHRTGEIGEAYSYVIEGMGEDFLPDNVHFKLIDDFVVVGDKETFQMTRQMLEKESIYAGGSSGAALLGAIRYAETLKEPKKILVILPDSGNRYSGKIYNDQWMLEGGYMEKPEKDSLDLKISELLKDRGVSYEK